MDDLGLPQVAVSLLQRVHDFVRVGHPPGVFVEPPGVLKGQHDGHDQHGYQPGSPQQPSVTSRWNHRIVASPLPHHLLTGQPGGQALSILSG